MLHDFKNFLMRGNVVDLAVAVIIGAAFGLIIKSFVADILMPIIGHAVGDINFENYFYALDGGSYATLAAAEEAGAAVVKYGSFATLVVNFIFVAAAIFVVVKIMENAKKKEAATPAAAPKQEVLLEEIRDLLKK